MVNPYRFYTYAYLREDRTPYYIGKGVENRLYKKGKKQIKPPKDKSRIIFLKQNLTEEEAFRHEIYMIAVFGRKDLGTGILRNGTNGGEGPSGAVRNKEWRKKQSEVKKGKGKGKKWWNDGCGNSKISVKCPGKSWVPGRNKQIKIKISETKKGKKNSKEHIENIRLSSKIGEINIKYWKITFADGNVVYQTGIHRWASENGYNQSHIGKVASGKLKKHKDIVAVEKLEHPPTIQEHFGV
jgi:hypothetical protein